MPYVNEKWQLQTCQKHKKSHASQNLKFKLPKQKKAAHRTAFFAKPKLQNTFCRTTGIQPTHHAKRKTSRFLHNSFHKITTPFLTLDHQQHRRVVVQHPLHVGSYRPHEALCISSSCFSIFSYNVQFS